MTPAGVALTLAAVLTVMVVGAALAGVGAGRGLRALLSGLRRGARAAPGWCEAGVGAAVLVPVAGAALGAVDRPWVPAWVGLGVLLTAVTVTDLAHRRIPNALTLPALPAMLLLVVPLGPDQVLAGLGGAALALLAHAAVRLLAPASLGAGDVKLATVLGVPLAAASWWALALAPLGAAMLAAVVATATRRRSVPLGPLLAGVSWVLVAAAAGVAP